MKSRSRRKCSESTAPRPWSACLMQGFPTHSAPVARTSCATGSPALVQEDATWGTAPPARCQNAAVRDLQGCREPRCNTGARGHWTKHTKCLARDLGRVRYGDVGYAREALVAELGAAFLSPDLGITPAMHSGPPTFCTVCSRSGWSRTGPPHRRPFPSPVPALCSTPRGARASDCRDALRPDSTRCATAHKAGQGRRVLHAAAPQARGATRSASYRASMVSTPRSHPLRRPSTVARDTKSVTDYGAATL